MSLLRIYPALASPKSAGMALSLDLSGFAALPPEEESAVQMAAANAASAQGATAQQVIDACTAGYLWMSSQYSLYSDLGGTTLIAGATGNPINAWRDWSKNTLFAVNSSAPTFNPSGVDFTSDGMIATTIDPFGAQNNRTIIFAVNQYQAGRNHFISNATSDSTNDWYIDSSSTEGGLVHVVNGRSTSGNATPNMTTLANHIARVKATNSSSNVEIWVDGIQRVTSTELTAATANPNPNQLTIHAQTDAFAKKSTYYKAIYAHSGDQSPTDSALVEEFINQYFSLGLL